MIKQVIEISLSDNFLRFYREGIFFQIESLLHLRESAREKALVGYAKSIQNRQKIESELKNLEASLEKLHRDITSRRSSSLEASADQSFQKAVLSLSKT